MSFFYSLDFQSSIAQKISAISSGREYATPATVPRDCLLDARPCNCVIHTTPDCLHDGLTFRRDFTKDTEKSVSFFYSLDFQSSIAQKISAIISSREYATPATVFLSYKEYDYNGIRISVYAGYNKHYMCVDGQKCDEHNTIVFFTPIVLKTVLKSGENVEVIISLTNRISTKVNGRLLMPLKTAKKEKTQA